MCRFPRTDLRKSQMKDHQWKRRRVETQTEKRTGDASVLPQQDMNLSPEDVEADGAGLSLPGNDVNKRPN